MKLNLISKFRIITVVLLVAFLCLIESCKYKNNSNFLTPDSQRNLEYQDEKIAKFLVETTNINIQIIELSSTVENNSNNEELKKLFKIQEGSIFRIQNDIKKISEDKLVTLPFFSGVVKTINKKQIIVKDNEYIDELMNLLVNEVLLFEKIKLDVKDRAILSFQEQYKPVLDGHLELISAMKVENYSYN